MISSQALSRNTPAESRSDRSSQTPHALRSTPSSGMCAQSHRSVPCGLGGARECLRRDRGCKGHSCTMRCLSVSTELVLATLRSCQPYQKRVSTFSPHLPSSFRYSFRRVVNLYHKWANVFHFSQVFLLCSGRRAAQLGFHMRQSPHKSAQDE